MSRRVAIPPDPNDPLTDAVLRRAWRAGQREWSRTLSKTGSGRQANVNRAKAMRSIIRKAQRTLVSYICEGGKTRRVEHESTLPEPHVCPMCERSTHDLARLREAMDWVDKRLVAAWQDAGGKGQMHYDIAVREVHKHIVNVVPSSGRQDAP